MATKTALAFSTSHNYSKYLVPGYVREINIDNVPMVVCYMCAAYYFHGEYFTKAGDGMVMEDNQMSVSHLFLATFSTRAYGNLWIESTFPGITRWSFKFHYPAPVGYARQINLGLISKVPPNTRS